MAYLKGKAMMTEMVAVDRMPEKRLYPTRIRYPSDGAYLDDIEYYIRTLGDVLRELDELGCELEWRQ